MNTAIKRLNPAGLPDSTQAGYSQITVVEPGRMAYVSGQVALDAKGGPVPSDLVDQAEIVFKNAQTALEALGATPHNIVIARIFVVDLKPEAMEQIMPQLLSFFDGAEPCITGVGVAALAAPEFRIEMELTVRLPD